MNALLIKNSPEERPGNIIQYARTNGIDLHIVEAYQGFRINGLKRYEYLIVLGGPMGVYEMDRYPFLVRVAKVIEDALKIGIKILGICLGCQLLAYVLGGRVYKGSAQEIGWYDIEFTEEGRLDPCFGLLSEKSGKARVFQWHGDTFDLPEGATRLAFSSIFPEQAFRYGNSYGIQFHPEITPEMILEWSKDRQDLRDIIDATASFYFEYRQKANRFYSAFFKA